MKITLITGIYPPDIGGPATFVPQLAAELQARGHVVQALSLRSSNQSKRQYLEWDEYFILRDGVVPLRFIKTVWKIIKVARNSDVIFANGLHQEAATANFFIRKKLIAKIVGDPVWERWVNNALESKEIEAFQNQDLGIGIKLQRIFLTWSLNQFHTVITPGKSLVSTIRNWRVITPIRFIPNGTPEANPAQSDLKQFDVILVNRLVRWKNVDLLISACAGTNLKLAIVGEGPELDNLKSFAKRQNVKAYFLGGVDTDTIDYLMRNSRIFALISSYEGMSFSLLRAMMLGMPILVSNIPANMDVIENNINGIVVDIADISKIKNAIENLLADPEGCISLGLSARQKALNEFSLSKVLGRTIDELVGKEKSK
jgi:glycosyltransferase involved in cell wall biosynthesis